MRYMLDTDICIYLFKGNKAVAEKISKVDPGLLCTSIITIAELLYGAKKSERVIQNTSRLKDLEQALDVLNIDRYCIDEYASIKVKLKKDGKIIEDFDILIAAIAIVNDCILVTNNTNHFGRIDGLKLENWVQ